jgi:lipopolysaccharide transport system permease protein
LNNSQKITYIKTNSSWWDLNFLEILKYKGLIYLLIRRDFVTSYKQTILGPIWVVLQVLMGSAIFSVIFGNIAGLSTDGHPAFLFYLCGSLAWHYFGSVLGISSSSLQAHQGLFSKVYFPRIIPPLCDSISALLNFFIQFIVLSIAIIVYRSQVPDCNTGPSLMALLLPLLVLQSALLGLGFGFIISSISVKYRDLGRLGGLLSQFLMYASPVIYPISEIPVKYQPYLAYNPLTFIVESYRYLLLGHSTGCTLQFAIPSVITTCVLFFIGLILYNKIQRTYVDYV